jgi:hypothetical protein
MLNTSLETPIVLIIFKRPDTTSKVFEVIRQAKPEKLLVIADGARTDRLGEAEKCAAARAIIDRVDWDCEVLKNYSDINLGCARRVSSGLNWVFDQVEEAIILEDDCVPDPTFFPFCEELLDRYRYDTRIMAISGQNVQFGRKRTDYSYYFSRYNHCWGWATWRRAWQHFDFDMKLWSEVQSKGLLNDLLETPDAVERWTQIFQDTYDGQNDSWAYRWTFACWVQSSLSILSNVNLVSNIGFGSESTHTTEKASKLDSIPAKRLDFPLKHPPLIIRDAQADRITQQAVFEPTRFNKFKGKVKSLLGIKSVRKTFGR